MTTRGKVSIRAWFPDELEAALAAVAASNGDLAQAVETPEMRIYRRGFDAALRSLAVLFMVEPPAAGRDVVVR